MATESAPAIDPIHQFHITRWFEAHPGGIDVSFTNASLFMLITILAVTAFMVLGTSGRHLVPTRLQAAAEMTYEFIASTVRNTAGHEGMKFFPFVFSLFIFVLFSNLIGLIPYTFSVASQIVVTFALAATVITIVIVYGFFKNGTHFLGLFAPAGVPKPLLVLLIPIEVISFLSRPISLSVRLFANILAGHITLQVFGGFVLMLLGGGSSRPWPSCRSPQR